jgi:hypothetical protein
VNKERLERIFRGFAITDGAFRSVLVENFERSTYDVILGWLRQSRWPAGCQLDDVDIAMPESFSAAELLSKGHTCFVKIDIAGKVLHYWFHDPDRLELYAYPPEFHSVEELLPLLDFMKDLATLLGRRVYLAGEDSWDERCAEYDPLTGIFSYHDELFSRYGTMYPPSDLSR